MPKLQQAARFSLLRRKPASEATASGAVRQPHKLRNTRHQVNARKNHIVALVRSRPRRLIELSAELGYNQPNGAFELLTSMVDEGRLEKRGVFYVVTDTQDPEPSKRPSNRKKSRDFSPELLQYMLEHQNQLISRQDIASAIGYRSHKYVSLALMRLVREGKLERYLVPGDGKMYRFRVPRHSAPAEVQDTQNVGAPEGLVRATGREGQVQPVDSKDETLNLNEKRLLLAVENLARDCYWATGDLAVRDGVTVMLQWAKERMAHDNTN